MAGLHDCTYTSSQLLADKKGKEMGKVKQFVKDHKKELSVIAAGLIIYRMGYRNGFNASERAINNIFEQASIYGGK